MDRATGYVAKGTVEGVPACPRSPDLVICSLESLRGGRAIMLSNTRRTSVGARHVLGMMPSARATCMRAATVGVGAAKIGEIKGK